MKKSLHTSIIDGEKYYGFVGRVCARLKEALEVQMNRCDTCDLREHKTENDVYTDIPRSEQLMWRGLENWFPELVKCTFCIDLKTAAISDFNKLVRTIEKSAEWLDHERWF